MAYVVANNEEEQKPGQTPTSTQPGATPVVGSTDGNSAPLSGTAPAGSAGSGSSYQPFATIQEYLKPNQIQAQDMANQVSKKISAPVQEARQTIQTADQQFKQAIENATPKFDQSLVDQAVADPTAFVRNQDNLSKINAQRTATYSGPSQFEENESYQDIIGKMNKANETKTLLDSMQGYDPLIREITPNATAGEMELNKAALSLVPEAQSTIEAQKPQFQALTDYLNNVKTTNAQAIQAAKDQALQVQQNTMNPLTSKESEFEALLNANLKKEQDAATQRQAAIDSLKTFATTALAGKNWMNKPTEGMLTQLGLTADQYKKIREMAYLMGPEVYGHPTRMNWDSMDLSKYLTYNQAPDISIENVSTVDDYAKSAALAQIMGDQGYLNQNASASAGTGIGSGSKNLTSFNLKNIVADINARREAILNHTQFPGMTWSIDNSGNPLPNTMRSYFEQANRAIQADGTHPYDRMLNTFSI